MMPQVPNTSGPLVSVPEVYYRRFGSRCPASVASVYKAVACLTEGRFQKTILGKLRLAEWK